ncbi:MAG: CDP-diacylglycerol--serine O-phosphatidyltransferase [Methanobrevibacter sp.]|nr:CDP-diacylglycerol--serine O-phosphatidyltransferase [Candidatus Methanovirga australis]MDR2544816.1 CDP-diacylglycerol--serine O-phosphatidyltransferase [Candidatus Methanovirga procula]
MKIKKTNIKNFLSIPDFITLLNLSFGFISILLSIDGYLRFSAISIIFASICDSADGWVARKIGRNDEYGFGKSIDALSDIVSFGVAPGIILYSICRMDNPKFICISAIISLFMVITGVLRLTRSNVIADHLDFKGFIGLPITATGLLISTFILTGIFHVNAHIAILTIISLMFISSILMISNIKYPKFNMRIVIIALILTLLIIIPIPISYNEINIPATILFTVSLMFTTKLFK